MSRTLSATTLCVLQAITVLTEDETSGVLEAHTLMLLSHSCDLKLYLAK